MADVVVVLLLINEAPVLIANMADKSLKCKDFDESANNRYRLNSMLSVLTEKISSKRLLPSNGIQKRAG